MSGPRALQGLVLAAAAGAAVLGAFSSLGPARVTEPAHPRPAEQRVAAPPSSTGAVRSELVAGREAVATADAAPHGSLRVDVVEPDGEPAAGVWVACGRLSPAGSKVFEALSRSCTDASGSAWIALPEGSTPGDARPGAWPDEPLRVRAEILAEPAPEIVFDPGAPQANILLRLPPTGSVLLEACDTRGNATSEPVRFGVCVRAEGETQDLSPLPLWLAAPHGVAVLRRVGLGLALRVVADPQGDCAREGHAQAEGPGSAGEERTISVALGDAWPSVCLRVVDEEGQALRNEELEALVSWRRPATALPWAADASLPVRVRTDGDGRACFPVRGTVAGGYARRLVLTRIADAAEGHASTRRSAEQDLSWDWSGVLELGDVVLRCRDEAADVLWVSGTVVDPGGAPVRSATVLVSAADPDGSPLRGPAAQAAAGADGAFTAAGPPLAARLAVRARAPGFLPSAQELVAPGTSGLSIRMRPAARWEGRVLLDPDVPPTSLVVVLTTGDGRRQIALTSEHVVVDDLEEALIDVEVRVREGDWLVERWPGLSTSGAHDAVDTLDLRGRLTPLQLLLVGPDGRALDRVRARIRPQPWPEGSSWIHAGRLDLVVPADAAAITVEPHGYRSIAVEPRVGIQELTVGR